MNIDSQGFLNLIFIKFFNKFYFRAVLSSQQNWEKNTEISKTPNIFTMHRTSQFSVVYWVPKNVSKDPSLSLPSSQNPLEFVLLLHML